jgi:hypothetical protein
LKHFDGLAFMGMGVTCKEDNDRRGKNAHVFLSVCTSEQKRHQTKPVFRGGVNGGKQGLTILSNS